MKKAFFFFAALPFLSLYAQAQMPYNLTVLSGQTYQPLTGGTSMNGTVIWDEENFTAPLGFVMRLGNDTTSFFYALSSVPGCANDTTGNVNGFALMDADMFDRGTVTGAASLSPIRYTLTGTVGSRIFKCEYFNAGFVTEYDNTGSANDSVNVQIWYYEGSNIVELHYGPSKISAPGDYFNFGNGPLIGYGNDIDFVNGSGGTFYYLTGNTSSPTVDSFSFPPSTFPVPVSSYPANGMVYRFTPKPTGIHDLNMPDVNVYPTTVSNALHIDNGGKDVFHYSVVYMSGAVTDLKGEVKQGAATIDISALPAGMYLLQLQNGNGRGVYKFVKL